jgi:7-cyano-7-deazaguanine synthase in queuosine biosynthesis
MKKEMKERREPPALDIHVAETSVRTGRADLRCQIGREVEFSTESLESYFFSKWRPEAYDALLVAAAVEFADKSLHRPEYYWRRAFSLRVPVHDVDHWQQAKVSGALREALEYLTGDSWNIRFYGRHRPQDRPQQTTFELSSNAEAVIPFSNGLDSRAVAALMQRSMKDGLVRVRLASKLQDSEGLRGHRLAFTNIPYKVGGNAAESSMRSRGFKFSLISGIAAFLSGANRVIVPESGQGALGPSLVPVGQTYDDYRSHPTFTRKMERFLKALFEAEVEFVFPQLWETKAETLKRFIDECGDRSWRMTRSCWQQSRQVGVNGKRRQCGICAACMLRRMSVHGAGADEPGDQYVWERLDVGTFEKGVAKQYSPDRIGPAMQEYAIAGTLHLDHLAALRKTSGKPGSFAVPVFHLSQALGIERDEVRRRLERLIAQHAQEWTNFVSSLGSNSFIARWAVEAKS